MKTLILMRHAKSSWSSAATNDHDRPLNTRGQTSAPAMGAWVTERTQPELVLCSTALRTRETLAASGIDARTIFEDELYHASALTMLRHLRGAGDAGTVMMVGHNPGIGAFASQILRTRHPHPQFHDYPTCATLIARFEIGDWQSVDFGAGTAVDFAIPREVLSDRGSG